VLNTDAQDSSRRNALRRDAKDALVAAVNHALRCGVLGFEQASRIVAIITESKRP
jgi:hypothetical protein